MKKLYLSLFGMFMFMFMSTNFAFADPGTNFDRTLRRGLNGDDVKILQALLTADENVYGSTVFDGKFGPFTQQAVIKFQSKFGIGADGVAGPITFRKLDEMRGSIEMTLELDENGLDRPCIIVPPGHLIASGWLRKNWNNKPVVPVCQKLPLGIAKKVGDDYPNIPDTIAPVISVLTTSNISVSSARANWKTNESTTGKVYFSTTTPVNMDTASVSSDNSLDKDHSMLMNGLSANTKYYFVIKARDSSGNESVSAEQNFTTRVTNAEDNDEPIISGIMISGVGSVVANIHWNTDEYATSKVYYSAISPIDLSTALVASNLSLSYGHEIVLSGLVTNTTYYYVVESKDSSGNTARSSEQHFKTF
jgi:peptidoglycan hydrolase-like protein with peptidoglycan-binding domain